MRQLYLAMYIHTCICCHTVALSKESIRLIVSLKSKRRRGREREEGVVLSYTTSAATYRIVGVRHCVEWTDGQRILVQHIEVSVILRTREVNFTSIMFKYIMIKKTLFFSKRYTSKNSKPPLSFIQMIKHSLGPVLESELVIGSIQMIKISLGVVQVTPENVSLAYVEFNLLVCVPPYSSLVYKHTHFTR